MTEKQTYRFADGNQQTEWVNRVELIIFAVFALCNFCIVFVAFVRGYQTAVFTAVTFAISIGAVIAMELHIGARDKVKRFVGCLLLRLLF